MKLQDVYFKVNEKEIEFTYLKFTLNADDKDFLSHAIECKNVDEFTGKETNAYTYDVHDNFEIKVGNILLDGKMIGAGHIHVYQLVEGIKTEISLQGIEIEVTREYYPLPYSPAEGISHRGTEKCNNKVTLINQLYLEHKNPLIVPTD